MRRSSTAVVATLTAALVLTSCSDSSDGGGPGPTGTATSSDGGRSTTGQVTACTVVDRSVADPLNPNDRDLVPTLLIGDLTYDGCTVGDVYSISFGIKVVDSDETLEDRVELLGSGDLEPLDGLGDEAFRSEDSFGGEAVTITIGVRSGDHEVILRNDSVGNSDPANRVSEDAMVEFLEAYVPAIPADFGTQALTTNVGTACVPADDVTIEEGVDTIQLARGGRGEDSIRCTYLGTNLATVQLSRSSDENPAQYLDLSRDNGETVVVAGAEDAVLVTSGRSVDLTIQPNGGEVVFVNATTRSGSLDPAAITAIAEAFLVSSAGT